MNNINLDVILQTEGFAQDPNDAKDQITIQRMYELCHPSFVETLWHPDEGVYRTCCDTSQVG